MTQVKEIKTGTLLQDKYGVWIVRNKLSYCDAYEVDRQGTRDGKVVGTDEISKFYTIVS